MATKASPRGAIPRTMSETQFERVLGNGARFAVVLVGIVVGAAALSIAHQILAPVSLAIVVGLMFGPLADGLERRNVPSALSAALVVILFIGIFATGIYLFSGPISEWVARGPQLWAKLQEQLRTIKEPLESLGAAQEQIKGVFSDQSAVAVEVQDGGTMQDVALMAPTLLADILLFLASLYFFVATRDRIRIAVLSLCFSRRIRWRVAHVFRDVEHKVSTFLLSSALINLGVGTATTLAMWALGMPSPLLWGALAAVLNFIPYVGQAVMIAVLFAVGLSTASTLPGMLLPVAVYLIINLAADQVIFPHLVGKALTLNPFVILVTIAFWIWLWGPIGGFIAVPFLLVVQSMILHILPIGAPRARKRKPVEPALVAPAKRAVRKPAISASP